MAETTAAAIEKGAERGGRLEDPRPADLFALSCVYLCFEAPRRRTAGVRAVSVLAGVDAVLLCAWALVQVVQVALS